MSCNDIIQWEGILGEGFGMVPRAVMTDPRLSAEAKAVYAYFAAFSSGGGESTFPPVSTVAQHLGLTEEIVTKHIGSIADAGWTI